MSRRQRSYFIYRCPACGWWTTDRRYDRCQNRTVHDPPIEPGKLYDLAKFPLLDRVELVEKGQK